MDSTNLTLSRIITMIWLQIVTIVPMDGERIRRFGMVAPYLLPILVAIVKVRTPGNSVGVAFPQPRVEVRSASTLGAIYKSGATL